MAKLALSPELAAWATKIALEVDPDNAALAPMMLDAYVQGGAKRKQLFESTAEVGGFLAEGMTPLLALSFVALSLIGNELMRLLASGALGAITSVLVGWKTWLEILKIRRSGKEDPKLPEEKDDAYASLYRVSQKVEKALMKRGLSAEQSEWLTYHVIKALLEDPAGAAKLIVQIPAE